MCKEINIYFTVKSSTNSHVNALKEEMFVLLTKSLLSFFKMSFCSVCFFFPPVLNRKENASAGGRGQRGGEEGRGEGDPLSVRTVPHRGAEMTDAPLREEGGREQKDGGNERKSKEENQEIKITYGTVLKKSGMKS